VHKHIWYKPTINYVCNLFHRDYTQLAYYNSPVSICLGDGSTTVIVLEVGARVGDDEPGTVGRLEGTAKECVQ